PLRHSKLLTYALSLIGGEDRGQTRHGGGDALAAGAGQTVSRLPHCSTIRPGRPARSTSQLPARRSGRVPPSKENHGVWNRSLRAANKDAAASRQANLL